ncbi:hypothetical protein DFP72DRAFT_162220 [Ephemerocybe angulata]|uniref:C2H2-type domain-containing protein n=1 Tax=Ephemerocybe angulata TaxID=980116 RepID=A0A8H6I565_9AGAR|nr:hypothetical protein DFP72DRAFT_162220 [Tulosesus angulatus]
MPLPVFSCADCSRWSYFVESIEKHYRDSGHRRRSGDGIPPTVPMGRTSATSILLYGCADCDRVCRSVQGINSHCAAARHRRQMDNGTALVHWPCDDCNDHFTSEIAYNEHVKRCHHKPVSCSFPGCRMQFLTKSGLDAHLRYVDHQGQANPPPIPSRRETLTEHRRPGRVPPPVDPPPVVRTPITPTLLHGCGDCNSIFPTVAALNTHCFATGHRGGGGSGPWVCEPCKKEFLSAIEYRKHIKARWHGKIGCEVPECPRRFKKPSGYASHLESGHHAINRHQVAQAVHLLQVVPPITIDTPTEFMAKHGIEFIPDQDYEAEPRPTVVDEEGIASDPASFLPGPPLGPREEEASAVAAVEPSSTALVSASSLGQLQRFGPLPLGQSLLASPSFQVYVPDDFIHLDVPYACPLCTKTFSNVASLTAHMNSPVHDPDAFMCPGCKKRFAMVSSLIQHLESGTCKLASTKEIFDNFSNLTSRFSALLISSS